MPFQIRYGGAFAALLRLVISFGNIKWLAARLGCSPTRLARAIAGRESFHLDWLAPLYLATRDRRLIDYLLAPLGIAWFELAPVHLSPGDTLAARWLAAEEVLARFRTRVIARLAEPGGPAEDLRDLLAAAAGALAGVAACLGVVPEPRYQEVAA